MSCQEGCIQCNEFDWSEAFSVCRPTATVGEELEADSSVKLSDIAVWLAHRAGCNDAASWLAVVQLRDGRFVAVSAWCDYTGWDCRAGGSILVSATLERLGALGLDDE